MGGAGWDVEYVEKSQKQPGVGVQNAIDEARHQEIIKDQAPTVVVGSAIWEIPGQR